MAKPYCQCNLLWPRLDLTPFVLQKKERAGRVEFVITALSSYTFCFKISKHLKRLKWLLHSMRLLLHMATWGIFLKNKPKTLSPLIKTSIGSLWSIEIVSKLFSIEPSKSKQFLNMYSQQCVFIFTSCTCITLLIHYVHYKIYTKLKMLKAEIKIK